MRLGISTLKMGVEDTESFKDRESVYLEKLKGTKRMTPKRSWAGSLNCLAEFSLDGKCIGLDGVIYNVRCPKY